MLSETERDVAAFVHGNEDLLRALRDIHTASEPEQSARALLARAASASHANVPPEAMQALLRVVLQVAKRASESEQPLLDHTPEDHEHERAVTQAGPQHVGEDHGKRYHHDARPRFAAVRDGAQRLSAQLAATERTALLDLEAALKHEPMTEGRRARASVLGVVVLVTLGGCLYALVLGLRFPGMVRTLSAWVLLARGCAMSLVLLTALIILFMCRGLVSDLRSSRAGGVPLMAWILDLETSLHRICGELLSLFAFGHVLGHCCGSIPALLAAPSLEVINAATTGHGKVPFNPTSLWQVLSLQPAWTGVVLVLILVGFFIFSSAALRKKHHRVFETAHELLIGLWIVFLYLHGASQWLGIGIPLVVPVCGGPILLYLRGRVRRALTPEAGLKRVVTTHRLIYLETDRQLAFHLGQYAQIQVPEITYEWHPFTIASSPMSGHASFLIAATGDWTSALRTRLQRQPWPKVYVSGGYGAPAEAIPASPYLVMVGSGVGITPFLGTLQELVVCHRAGVDSRLVEHLQKAKFLWITREPEDFAWCSSYVEYINSCELKEKVSIELVLTGKLESVVEATLFWQAAKVVLTEPGPGQEALKQAVGVPTQFGRPNFKKELEAMAHGLPKHAKVNVFVCGNAALARTLSEACDAVSKGTDDRFVLHREEF